MNSVVDLGLGLVYDSDGGNPGGAHPPSPATWVSG